MAIRTQHSLTCYGLVWLLLMCTCVLQTDDDPVHLFTEVFHLKQENDSLFIVNQMFRLGLHHS